MCGMKSSDIMIMNSASRWALYEAVIGYFPIPYITLFISRCLLINTLSLPMLYACYILLITLWKKSIKLKIGLPWFPFVTYMHVHILFLKIWIWLQSVCCVYNFDVSILIAEQISSFDDGNSLDKYKQIRRLFSNDNYFLIFSHVKLQIVVYVTRQQNIHSAHYRASKSRMR